MFSPAALEHLNGSRMERGAVVGEDVDATALELGRRLLAALGWPEDFEDEARKLRQRKAILFPTERRLFLGVEVAREGGGLRVYAVSAAG